ncbi:hypothetical protein EON65_44350 [archaeon]|nr:MAG: hypothetical protein EON65_44350 [archaeon]
MYLIVVGNEVCADAHTHSLSVLQDTLFQFSGMRDTAFQAELTRQQLTSKSYMYLLSPALEWTVKKVGRHASKETFQSILQLYR